MYVHVNNLRLAISDRGRQHEMAFLLVHGFPLNRRLWQAQANRLVEAARVLAPDLRGQGYSEAPPGPYTMEQHAEDLRALLDERGIARAIVTGLSMGGYIAFEFWRRYPERVQALVLCDTKAAPDDEEGRANRDRSAQRVREIGVEAFGREMMPRLLARESLEDTQLAGRALAMMSMQTVEGIAGALAGMRDRPDSRPTLSTINVPVLLLFGEQDQFTPPKVGYEMAAALRDARVVVIPRAGHLSPLENPRAVNAALLSFLADVRERAGT